MCVVKRSATVVEQIIVRVVLRKSINVMAALKTTLSFYVASLRRWGVKDICVNLVIVDLLIANTVTKIVKISLTSTIRLLVLVLWQGFSFRSFFTDCNVCIQMQRM